MNYYGATAPEMSERERRNARLWPAAPSLKALFCCKTRTIPCR